MIAADPVSGWPSPGQGIAPLMIREVQGPGGSRGESILLVEDEPAVRALLARVLRGRGYVVTEAGDGAQALALAAARVEPFDLLLTDVIMPEVGGIELAARLHDSGLAASVIFMTGYTDIPIEHAGAAIVLRKPFAPATLAEAVRRALNPEV